MKVKEFITELLEYNQDAEIGIIINNEPYCEIPLCYGNTEGCTKRNCQTVEIYHDLCNKNEANETTIGECDIQEHKNKCH